MTVGSLLVIPFTYGGALWDINVLISSLAFIVVAATALLSAIGLLSKNFPVPMALVIGVTLVLSTVSQTQASSALMGTIQVVALVLLGLFLVSRMLVESAESKTHSH